MKWLKLDGAHDWNVDFDLFPVAHGTFLYIASASTRNPTIYTNNIKTLSKPMFAGPYFCRFVRPASKMTFNKMVKAVTKISRRPTPCP